MKNAGRLAAAALASAALGGAFAPSPLRPRTTSRPLTARAAALPAIVADPYRNLPWNVARREAREARRLTYDNAALFRELGLPEDATYEDVAAMTEHLIGLTAGLPKNEALKKKIKIEIARDKIYQIRLNERISGVRQEQEDAARVSKLEDEGIDGLIAMTTTSADDILKPKAKLRIPLFSNLFEWFQSIYTPPDEAWRKRCITVWGLATLACLALPPLVENFSPMQWLPAGGMIGFRGMPVPEGGEGGFNPYRGKRNKKHNLQAIAIAIPAWVLARSVSHWAVAHVPFMAASKSADWFRFAIVQGLLCTLVMYTQTYKEGEEGGDLMI